MTYYELVGAIEARAVWSNILEPSIDGPVGEMHFVTARPLLEFEGYGPGSTLPEVQWALRLQFAKRGFGLKAPIAILPVRVWTSATCLAELAASSPGNRAQQRCLSVADFQFRGGCPGWSRGLFARTRIGELAV